MSADTSKWILYQTTNLINSKTYIGVHKLSNTRDSINYLGSGLALKPAIKKYGRHNFKRVTLAEFSCAEDAYAAEAIKVTEEFCNRVDTYNMKVGGRGSTGVRLGVPLTEEHKAKIGVANKGKKPTEEHRAKMIASRTGKKHPKSIPVIVNGIYYESSNLASKAENLPSSTVFNRVKNNSPSFSNYRFATEEEKAQHQLP